MQNIEDAPRRLKFFWDMVQMCGYNRNSIAKVLGYTQPSVQSWWASDDVRFSVIYDTAKKLDIELDISLTRKGGAADDTQPLYISDVIRQIDGRKYTVRKLEFLEMALRRYNIHKTDWAKAINTGHVTIYQWFTKDDIMWSRICQMAEAFNLDINIRMTFRPQSAPDNVKSRILVSITSEYGYETPSKQ